MLQPGTLSLHNLIFGAAIPGISNAAHIGGLLMGLAVGALLPSAAAPESSRRARLSLVTVFSVLMLCASAFAAKHLTADVSALSSIRQLAKTGKADEAISQLEQLTARQPDLASAQSLLASLYYGKSRYPEAVAAMEKAYAAEPANPTYQQQLGAAYLSLGEYDQAIAFFQKLTTQNPKDPRPYLGLGVAYMGQKKYDSAISPFRQAVALDPKSAKAQHALGQAQLRAGRFADAQGTYRHLLAQFPNDKQAQASLAFATQQLH